MKMNYAEFEAYLDGVAKKGLALWDGTAMSVGVIKDGEVVLCKGYGMRDMENSVPATGRTLYQIGSCTKAFTSTLCAVFADKGLIDWDTPLREYVPDLRFYDDYTTDHCTLRDVLCHRTGVPRHEYSWYGTDFTRAQLLHNIRYLEPNRPFRTDYQYNNYGYLVAGYVLETVSGKTYEELLQEYIFTPLGMTRTNAYLDLLESDEDCALPYDRPGGVGLNGHVKGAVYRTPCEDMSRGIGSPFAAAGSINSCCEDMLKWVQFHLQNGRWGDEQLVSEKNLSETHRPNIISSPQSIPSAESDPDFTTYAMGWQSECYRGVKVFSHGGNINGYSAYTAFAPELNLGIVIYTNLTTTMQHYGTGRMILDCFLDAEPIDWVQRYYDYMLERGDRQEALYRELRGEKVEGTHPTFPIESYVGDFERPGYGKLGIRLVDGKLHLLQLGSDVPLSHYCYDCFITDISYGGDELKPGLAVKFFAGDRTAAPDVVAIPLIMEEGKYVRFTRRGK